MPISVASSYLLNKGRYRQHMEELREDLMREFELSWEQVISKSRREHFVMARTFAVARMHGDFNMPFAEIGRRLNRDHTSIMHLWKKAHETTLH